MESRSWFGDNSVTRVAGSTSLSTDAFLLFRGFPGEPPPGQAEKYRHLASRAPISAALHAATGLDVYVPQYPGLGGSRGRFGFEASVERSLAFALEALPQEYERVHIAGYSWGGLVGYNVGRALGARRGLLILISPVADLGTDEDLRRFLPPYVRDYPNVFGPYDGALGPALADLRAVRDAYNPMTLAAKDPSGSKGALLVHGRRDEEIPVDSSRRFKELFPARYAELDDDHVYTANWNRMLSGICEFASRGTTQILGA